ncbi:hypothetical protein LguiA_009948 [Lonicera macranthoides]
MACSISSSNFILTSSSFSPCICSTNNQLKFPTLGRRSVRIRGSPFICNLGTSETNQEESNSKEKKNHLNLLKLSVTLTVVSASLPQPSLAAPKVKRSGAKKTTEALTPQELKKWSQGLPVVSNRIPYTEVLSLKRDGKLNRIIKPPNAALKQRPEVVLAVLEDSRVVRIVLPSVEIDPKFWDSWDELKVDSICVNAYSPPSKNPELPSPYLGFLMKFPAWMYNVLKPKPLSKKALELKRVREEFKRQRMEELRKMTTESEAMEKAIMMQKKREDREKRRELQKIKLKESLLEAQLNSDRMAGMWDKLANDPNVATVLGLLFFYLFYQLVVVGYKKKKKDYEDRLKIQKVDEEEKKKVKDLEREMAGLDLFEDAEGEEGAKGEKNAYMKLAKQFMRSGANVRRTDSVRVPQFLDRGEDVKFTDVAGLGKIRLELEEVVKFFTHGEIYRRRGVKIPGGILLCGPPGVGKTLLAKAVAGEAGVNFFSISASQFVEMYVGVGSSRVRALYEEARDNAPSVVFIDEIDAVGRARGMIKGSGGRERDATLNQLLVCLDGFQGRGDVITIASTNRPDILDPALVRPGRFDRKIYIPKPGLIGRMEILKVHARKKPMAEDLDYEVVASSTAGMVGAELANVIEIAAINMMRDGRTEITTDDLLQATQAEERGLLEKKERTPNMWKQLAINEAAMAVVAVNFPELRKIEFLTIAPRGGRQLGYVRVKMDNLKFNKGMLSRQTLLDHITVQLAQRAADEILYGEGQLSTMWARTANNARSAARTYVLGLSEKHYGVSRCWTVDRINEIDTEALRVLNTCYERAKEILQQNRKLLDAVADELVEKRSLTKQEFFNLVELHGSIKPMPPNILDIRVARLTQFQDAMMNRKETALRDSK